MRFRRKTPASQLVDETGVLPSPGWLLAGLCLASMAKAIEPPFEVFYPPTAAPFGAGWSLAHFLTSSQAVFLVLFMLAGGTLGDLYGRKKVLLWGIFIMLLANVLLLFSPSTLWHVIWRIVALVSAGVVLPLTLAPIYVFFEGRQRMIAFSIYLTVTALAGVLAVYLGKLFSGLLGWSGTYLLPGLISMAAMVIVYRSLPESRSSEPRFMDAVIHSGWTVLILAIVYTLFEISLDPEWMIVVLVVAGISILAGLVLITWWKHKEHGFIMRSAAIHTRHVTALIISGVIVQIALAGVYSLSYEYFRVGQNLSFSQTMLSLSPMFLGMLVTFLLIAHYWAYREVRQVVALGFLLVTAGIIGLFITARLPFWLQIIPLALFGFSIVGTKTVWTNALFQTLIDKFVGLNAGINSATVLVGGALGGYLTTQLVAQFGQSAFARQATLNLSEGARKIVFDNITAAIAAGEQAGLDDLAQVASEELYGYYQYAYVSGYMQTLLVIASLCMLVVVLIFLGIRRELKFRPEDTPLKDDGLD